MGKANILGDSPGGIKEILHGKASFQGSDMNVLYVKNESNAIYNLFKNLILKRKSKVL